MMRYCCSMAHRCAFAFLLGLASLHAQGNPFTGYTGYTDFYSLSYSGGSVFGPSNSGDVYVKINIGGTASGATISDGVNIDRIILDTGSRERICFPDDVLQFRTQHL